MGNKRITEKDFWICTNGAAPAQLQGGNETTKKISGEKYITIKDKATSSWIDFGCTKLMLIYAILAAAVVVIAAATVVTGGAALIAIGALAGLAGAAWGAVVGSMLCGQIAEKIRTWIEVPPANRTLVQGLEQVTGDYQMTCLVPGGTIKFAPNIKNWSQALSLATANYMGKLMEGMMAGALIGMGGAVISGGVSAFIGGGIRGLGQAALQLAKATPMNVLKNWVASNLFRPVTQLQSELQYYGQTGETSGPGMDKAATDGFFAAEIGTKESALNIYAYVTGSTMYNENGEKRTASWHDWGGIALWGAPMPKNPNPKQAPKTIEPAKVAEPPKTEPVKTGEPPKTEPAKETKTGEPEPAKTEEAEGTKADEEGVPKVEATAGETNTISGEAEAYSARLGERRITDDLYNELREQTPTQEIRNMVNEGVSLPMADFALPGLEITKRLHADHIVPMDKIAKMEGFDLLTKEQQLQVLNNPDNFTGLSPSANTSKGPKSFAEWTEHKSRGIQVDPNFRQEMILREQQLEGQLQNQIDNFLTPK